MLGRGDNARRPFHALLKYVMEKIIPRLVPMTPYEVYLQRVGSTFDSMRKTRQGFKYTPAQFGGLFGQNMVSNSGVVLEITEFEVN